MTNAADSSRSPQRSRFTSLALAGVLIVAMVSVVGVSGSIVRAPEAGAASVGAVWSPAITCGTFSTATPPPGTYSATLTLNGGGGGGGGNDSAGGGNGGQVTGSFALTHSQGAVSVDIGCGGGGGQSGSSCNTPYSGGTFGNGYEVGASGGAGEAETACLYGAAGGGGGGGGSALCHGTTGCISLVALAGGGGGGGGGKGCVGGSNTGGAGGAGESGGTGANSAGTEGSTSADGVGGGAGGPAGGSNAATMGANSGGNEANAGGGGGGGGAGGGSGGGGDYCTSGSDSGGGGGGGGSEAVVDVSSVSYNGNGGAGGGTNVPGTVGSITLTWNYAVVSITTPAAQTGTSGTAITPLHISASDSDSLGLTYSAAGLPPGLTIATSTGIISGTPTTGSSTPYSVVVTATDAQSATASTSAFPWTVHNTVTIKSTAPQSDDSGTTIASLPLTASTTGAAGGAGISSSGWSVIGGSLPPGLTLSSAGVVTGTPTTGGEYSATVQATDTAGFAGTSTLVFTIENVVEVGAPPGFAVDAGAAITPVRVTAITSGAAGGATITGWSLSGAPPGLSISSGGVISGTPTTGGSYPVTVTATDSQGFSATSSTFTVTVSDVVTVVNPGPQTSVSGTAITALPSDATVAGGGTIVGWSATGLPPGLTIDPSSGLITGTPTEGSTTPFSVTITAVDSSDAQGSATFDWTVGIVVSVTNPGIQADDAGVAISPLDIVASDSNPSATLTYAATGLPAGLSLDTTTGAITGTPTKLGNTSVEVTVTDDSDVTGSVTFAWVVNGPPTITTTSLPSGTVGVPYSQTLGVTGGTTPFTWSITSGTLPPGLSLDPSSGAITGTPTTPGTPNLGFLATDADGLTASALLSITIEEPGPYSALAPVRICDTRAGNPSSLSGPSAQCNGTRNAGERLVADTPLTIDVVGEFGVPADAMAVVLNVTAVNATGSGYLTVYPKGNNIPTASTVNVRADQRVANLVETGVGISSQVSVVANTAMDVVIDLQGYVAPDSLGGAGLYNPLASPARICDTRAGNPSALSDGDAQCDGTANAGERLSPNSPLTVTVDGLGGVPATGVSAVVLNVTAVDPSAAGYLTAYPQGMTAPTASNLNYAPGETIPNRVIVPVSAAGKISLVVNQTSDVLVDVSGWYSSSGGTGTEFTAEAAPVRICDTRPGNPSNLTGGSTQCNGTANAGDPLGARSELTLSVAGLAGVPSDAAAVVLNVTAVDPTTQTHLTVFPSGVPPVVSDLNPNPVGVSTNMVVATVSASGTIELYNYAGTVNVVVDCEGWYA